MFYKHEEKGLFLFVSVDDVRMAGKPGTLAAMGAELRTRLDLDPPTNLDGSVYLGVKQHEVSPYTQMCVAKRQLYLDRFHQQYVNNTEDQQQHLGHDFVTASERSTQATIMSAIPSPLRWVNNALHNLKFTKNSASLPSSYVSEMIGHAEHYVYNYCEPTGSTPSKVNKRTCTLYR